MSIRLPSLCSIENGHPFIPTCLLAEHRADVQWCQPFLCRIVSCTKMVATYRFLVQSPTGRHRRLIASSAIAGFAAWAAASRKNQIRDMGGEESLAPGFGLGTPDGAGAGVPAQCRDRAHAAELVGSDVRWRLIPVGDDRLLGPHRRPPCSAAPTFSGAASSVGCGRPGLRFGSPRAIPSRPRADLEMIA
jgi:hypothetical protein